MKGRGRGETRGRLPIVGGTESPGEESANPASFGLMDEPRGQLVEQNKRKNSTRLNRKSQFASYLETKRDKLHVQFDPETVDHKASSIFKGISCYFTGVADSDELRELLITNGGRFDHFLSKTNTTHIISDQLALAKKNTLKNALIVKSDWIRGCIEAGKVLPTGDYLLFKQPGIKDLFNMASKTTITVTSSDVAPQENNSREDGKDDAIGPNIQAQSSTINSAALKPVESAPNQANDDPMDTEQINGANDSAGRHSLEGKNLTIVTVSINNVRCTVLHTLQKYIGEVSCQLHIRLRELTLKGKSLTLTVGIKKQSEKDATNKAVSNYKSIKPPDQEEKSSYDHISRSTILPRASNDVHLINSYTNGLMSTIKVQVSHIKTIKLEMHNLEKCTEEEIAEWKTKATAQPIPTFTTPLKSDTDELKDQQQAPKNNEANRDTSDEPPLKRLSVETGESKRNKSPKKSPAKSPVKKSKGKAPAKNEPKSKFPGTIEMFFQKAAARKAAVNRDEDSDDVVIVTSDESNEATTSKAVSKPQSKKPKSSVLSSIGQSDPVPVLREWVITESEIHPEDVSFVTEFLSSLLQSKNWSKLKSCIEALYE